MTLALKTLRGGASDNDFKWLDSCVRNAGEFLDFNLNDHDSIVDQIMKLKADFMDCFST